MLAKSFKTLLLVVFDCVILNCLKIHYTKKHLANTIISTNKCTIGCAYIKGNCYILSTSHWLWMLCGGTSDPTVSP